MLEFNTASDLHEATTEDGEKVISCNLLSYGDYDNSGSVERANVRYCEREKLVAYTDHGGYGWVKVWLADTEENRELLEGLISDYPCLDDELVSEVEAEIEAEYIKDNDDIKRLYTPRALRDILDSLDMCCLEPELYYQAKENANMEFIVEAGGNGYINLERLAPEYNRLLIEKYPFLKTLQAVAENAELPEFFTPVYYNAGDMLNCSRLGLVKNAEVDVEGLLRYTAALETKLTEIKEGLL